MAGNGFLGKKIKKQGKTVAILSLAVSPCFQQSAIQWAAWNACWYKMA